MNQEKNYLTLKENGQHELIIKKSRFIASLARTTSVDEAKAFIQKVSKQYHDATHNTYAYTIGLNDEQVKASDNGEPSGTAGVPELKALQLMGLKDVTVVVTRYFGGIKLGAGGLIRAYSNSVTEAVQKIGVVKRVRQQSISFGLSYKQYDIVNHYLTEHNVAVASTDYGAAITIEVFLDEPAIAAFEQDLLNLLSGQVEFKKGPLKYREVPVEARNYHETNLD